MTAATAERINVIKDIVTEVLEIDPSEITDASRFKEDHNADSLRAIEILSRLEKHFQIEIPQNDLAKMTNLASVYAVVRQSAGWSE